MLVLTGIIAAAKISLSRIEVGHITNGKMEDGQNPTPKMHLFGYISNEVLCKKDLDIGLIPHILP